MNMVGKNGRKVVERLLDLFVCFVCQAQLSCKSKSQDC